MTGPKRIEVHGSTVFLFELDDPYPSRMAPDRAEALGRELIEASERARKNGRPAGRPGPTTTTTRDEER